MHHQGKVSFFFTIIFIAIIIVSVPVWACTGIRVKALNNSVVFARTMEFATEMQSCIMFVPRGQTWQASALDGKSGMKWKNTYAYMGPNAFGEQVLIEGVNEKGLYIGGFWFPGEAKYQTVTPAEYSKTLSPADFGNWILGNCATIDDVREKTATIRIAGVVLEAMGRIPPAHWYVMDSTGRALAIEPVDGGIKITENQIGIFTNSPSFDWHLTNLRNYVNLGKDNAEPGLLGNLEVAPIGQGSGMLGLPGDFTPPSRFVRAAFLANAVTPAKDADGAVNLAWNLISNITIPIGAVRAKDKKGTFGYDYTQWATVYDLSRNSLYFRTYYNQDVRVVHLEKLPFNGKNILFIPMCDVKPSYRDMTDQAK